MADNANPTIIIVKRVKKGGHGHHGGAWKVAYADFVTAMMAFFLLLWLLNAVTEEQLQGISNYFAPTTVSKSQSGAGGMLGGQVFGSGALPSSTSSPAVTVSLPPPTLNDGQEQDEGTGLRMETDEEAAARHEQEQFQEAAEKLKAIIRKTPDLAGMAQNILVDNTAEGLRIQLVDAENTAMFPSGSSAMMDKTKKIFSAIASAVNEMPQKVSISGHTDAVKFNDASGYTNWELSADRALASRRVLISAGIREERIARVVGRADTDPLVANNPIDPRNRRISIVLLRDIVATPQDQPKP
ncbi:MAG: flagellar motor protein MotB [Alphaproteobacteria bacterium]